MKNEKNENSVISPELVKDCRKNYAKKGNKLLAHAIRQVGIEKVALNHAVVVGTNHIFNKKVDNWTVMDQKQSGRCWIFAGMNLYKPALCQKLNVDDIKLSANYIQFWDFFEKANFAFNKIVKTAALPIDDRLVHSLVSNTPEGGWWDMFIALFDKYGIVPEAVMPDTFDAEKTTYLSKILSGYIRLQSKEIRELAQKEKGKKLVKLRQEFLEKIYNILVMHLGEPPEKFNWEYTDKDKKVVRMTDLTPKKFASQLAKQDCVTLINDPRSSRPYMKHYTSQYTGNVEERPLDFLNVEISVIKELVKKMLDNGRVVWMSCDVGKMSNNEKGIFHEDLYQFSEILGIPKPLTKADRLDYCDGGGNHAMLFTGYHEIDGKIVKWRIENSWGEKHGKSGYYEMSDKWFDEHVYTSLIAKEFLSKAHLKVLAEPAVELMPWETPY